MRVLSIGSDRKLFEKGSDVRSRIVEFGSLADELHVIVFSRRGHNLKKERLSENVWAYPTNSTSRLFYIFGAIRIANALQAEFITTQDPFEAGLVGFISSRRKNAKLQVQIHTDFLSPYFTRHSLQNSTRVLVARFLLPRADCIRVVSKRIFRSLSELRMKNYELRTRILPVYIEASSLQGEKTFNLREKYPQFNFIILVVSRLEKEKNISLALDVLKEVVKTYPKTGMVIIGEGSELENLRKKAKENNLQDHIVFEGWQSNLSSYYRSAHMFLLTSFYEGYGRTLVESALSGCPIVSSDVGIVGDVLKNEEHALVCPVGDEACFASKISRLIEENQLRLLLSQNAKAAAFNHLPPSWKAYLEQYKKSLLMCARSKVAE